MRIMGWVIFLMCVFFSAPSFPQGKLPAAYQYVFPSPGAEHVHPGTTIILRFQEASPKALSNLSTCIEVRGEDGGLKSGETTVASDGRTMIFRPAEHFNPGERVQVSIDPSFSDHRSGPVERLNFEFKVLEREREEKAEDNFSSNEKRSLQQKQMNAGSGKPEVMSNGVSVPSDFPRVKILHRNDPSSGHVFANTSSAPFYTIIFDTNGNPVWYRKWAELRDDFRPQVNGWMTMNAWEAEGDPDLGHMAYTRDFEYVKSFHAENGYVSDEHEFFMLPDSGYLLIGRRDTEVDMSQYVAGGKTDAIVRETCIQEFTAEDQLIFIWRAWDHFDIRDLEYDDLTSSKIRFPHMNALFTDDDGHILLSSRHLSEISKIHRQSGEFIWRMTGKPDAPYNDFQFMNDPLNGFRNQHDIRSLGNNRYTLLDNGNLHAPPVSRAVEYELDTLEMTANLIWEYRHDSSDNYARYRGNAQRLPNGNTHINWWIGMVPTIALEITPAGEKAVEMQFENGSNCYRTFRHIWEGKCPLPYLLVEQQAESVALIVNKFGDKDVDYYNIYGGTSPEATTLIDTCHSGLKEGLHVPAGIPYFLRVTAVDKSGTESDYSNEEEVMLRETGPGDNLIVNGDFSQDLDSWQFITDSSVTARIQTGESGCHVEIQEGGGSYRDVQLIQDEIPLLHGQKYLLEFEAMADASRIVELIVGKKESPWTDYSRLGFTGLTSGWEHYGYTFEMTDPTDLNASLLIHAGGQPGDVYLDHISLKMEVDPTSVYDPVPLEFALYPNHPNPFRGSTRIDCDLPEDCMVTLTIFNALGQRVKDYFYPEQDVGRFSRIYQLDGFNSGIYYFTLEARSLNSARYYRESGKMLLLK